MADSQWTPDEIAYYRAKLSASDGVARCELESLLDALEAERAECKMLRGELAKARTVLGERHLLRPSASDIGMALEMTQVWPVYSDERPFVRTVLEQLVSALGEALEELAAARARLAEPASEAEKESPDAKPE